MPSLSDHPKHNSALKFFNSSRISVLSPPETDLGKFTGLCKNSERESLQVTLFLILIFGATLQLGFWKRPLSTSLSPLSASRLPKGLIFLPVISFHPTPFLFKRIFQLGRDSLYLDAPIFLPDLLMTEQRKSNTRQQQLIFV